MAPLLIVVQELGRVMDSNLEHPENMASPRVETFPKLDTVFIFVLEKQLYPVFCNYGRLRSKFSKSQLLNASAPKFVRFGKFIYFKLLRPLKQKAGNDVTEDNDILWS